MTNEEKYQAFRRLYAGSDLTREDHRRFDALVRLLLDLLSPPPFKVGDFVTTKAGIIVRVMTFGTSGRDFQGQDNEGFMYWYQTEGTSRIAAWSSPEEPPR